MDDPEVIKAAFDESGFDANKLMEQMQDPDVKAKLIANTEAVERGVFGIPKFFVEDEMFFGKDKLWEVEDDQIPLVLPIFVIYDYKKFSSCIGFDRFFDSC